MKKLKWSLGLFAITAISLVGNQAHAQKGGGGGGAFEVGTTTVNIGIGLGRSAYGYSGLSYGTGFGFKAAIERGMWQLGPGVLSLGVEAGAALSGNGYYNLDNNTYKSNIVIASVRSAYHFGWNVDKLDTYGGVSLGPGFRSYGYSGNKAHDVVVAPGIFVGASYFFSPNIGVNVEAGYDITQLQGGVIFKF